MKWAWDVAFEMDFVVVILRSDTSKGQLGRKTFVVSVKGVKSIGDT